MRLPELTETELAEIEAIYAYLPEPSELEELIGTGERARIVSRLLREDVPALCRSLRAAWAELESLRNQQWCAERVIQWLDDPNPKPAIHAFTAGNERQIAYRVERLRAQLAQAQARILELETEIDTKAGYL